MKCDNFDGVMDHILDELGMEIVEICRNNGLIVTTPSSWDDSRKIPFTLAMIHLEISKALEAFLGDDREGFENKIAYSLISILGMTAGLGISIGPVIRAKLAVNRTRGYRHGGKRV